jgi:hypothetical protein
MATDAPPAEANDVPMRSDLFSMWDRQLDGAARSSVEPLTPSHMYSASATTLVATLVILCIVSPSFVLHRPPSALRSRTIVLSRVLIISLAAAAIVVGAPLAVSAWRGRSG